MAANAPQVNTEELIWK